MWAQKCVDVNVDGNLINYQKQKHKIREKRIQILNSEKKNKKRKSFQSALQAQFRFQCNGTKKKNENGKYHQNYAEHRKIKFHSFLYFEFTDYVSKAHSVSPG